MLKTKNPCNFSVSMLNFAKKEPCIKRGYKWLQAIRLLFSKPKKDQIGGQGNCFVELFENNIIRGRNARFD
jgi:hypothetical protein